MPCDVTRYWEVEAALAAAADTFGGLDVLVKQRRRDRADQPYRRNRPRCLGTADRHQPQGRLPFAPRAALPLMLTRGGGTIINISSGAAVNPLEAWERILRLQGGGEDVHRVPAQGAWRGRAFRALGLSPGTVATDMQREIKASGLNPVSQLEWTDHIPPEWPRAGAGLDVRGGRRSMAGRRHLAARS